MQQTPPDDTADATEPLPSTECGWFGSSLELREGLEVMELGVGLLSAIWQDPEAAPACSAA